MGSLSELADSLTPNVPARMTNLGANSDNLLDRRPGHDSCDKGFSQRTAAKKVPSDYAATDDHTRDQVEPLVSEI
jgi:hypothetical protein